MGFLWMFVGRVSRYAKRTFQLPHLYLTITHLLLRFGTFSEKNLSSITLF